MVEEKRLEDVEEKMGKRLDTLPFLIVSRP
jgi:hypothetical protein